MQLSAPLLIAAAMLGLLVIMVRDARRFGLGVTMRRYGLLILAILGVAVFLQIG